MATSMRQKVLTGLVVVVVVGLVVAVVAGRDSPTHRVLTAALHKHGCQEAAVVEQVQDAPKAWTGFRHKVDTSWRVDGCGAFAVGWRVNQVVKFGQNRLVFT